MQYRLILLRVNKNKLGQINLMLHPHSYPKISCKRVGGFNNVPFNIKCTQSNLYQEHTLQFC